MNREIQFMAWVKETKEMHNVKSIDFNLKIVNLNGADILKFSEVELLQYTGEFIHDTGEMIYEGDILEQSYLNPLNNGRIVKRYLICFENSCFKAKLIGHSPYGDTHLYFVMANAKTFDTKILGNSLKNPELLEVRP